MGRRGPQPEPTALKLERGNPGRRPLNTDEPVLAAASRAVPAGLKGRARREWTRLVDELVSKGVLTVGDMHAFEEYCTLVGEVDSYEKMIRRVGRETAHRLGYANYLLKLRTQLRQQAAHVGLTPSSRSGIKAVKVVAKDAAATKRERFFGGGKGA
jgi:P27 family predicted phage terminase small subunit